MKSLSIYVINGLVVAITESTRILSNSLVAFYSPHGKVSVRRKVGSDVKCDMTAHRLNGGDHSYAAGVKSHSELLKVPRVIKELETIL